MTMKIIGIDINVPQHCIFACPQRNNHSNYLIFIPLSSSIPPPPYAPCVPPSTPNSPPPTFLGDPISLPPSLNPIPLPSLLVAIGIQK
jgi:hypothetical protein